MYDPVQIALFIAIISLTTIAVLIGVQVFLIFSQIRQMMQKMNGVFDHASGIAQGFSRTIQNFSNLGETVNLAGRFFKHFKKGEHHERKQKE